MIKMITRKGYNGVYRLVYRETKDDSIVVDVSIGDTVATRRGEQTTIVDARAPHKPASSGFVNNYYAGVYGLVWVLMEEEE
jgi:hypothetical protein